MRIIGADFNIYNNKKVAFKKNIKKESDPVSEEKSFFENFNKILTKYENTHFFKFTDLQKSNNQKGIKLDLADLPSDLEIISEGDMEGLYGGSAIPKDTQPDKDNKYPYFFSDCVNYNPEDVKEYVSNPKNKDKIIPFYSIIEQCYIKKGGVFSEYPEEDEPGTSEHIGNIVGLRGALAINDKNEAILYFTNDVLSKEDKQLLNAITKRPEQNDKYFFRLNKDDCDISDFIETKDKNNILKYIVSQGMRADGNIEYSDKFEKEALEGERVTFLKTLNNFLKRKEVEEKNN